MNFIEKSILNTLAAIALCFIIHAIMNNFLGAIATLWIIRLLIIMVILTGIGFLGFNGYVFVQKRKLELENQRVSIAKSRYITHDTSDCLAIDTGRGVMDYFTNKRPPKSERTVIEMPSESSPVLIEDTVKPVLPLINKSLIVGLYGIQDAGKTTLLCHIIESRRNEPALILDPHGYAGKYPYGEMKGFGRNYDEIESCMKLVINEVNTRYQDYRGQKYSPLTIYIDELTLLHKFCPSYMDFMGIMTSEIRKVGIKLVFCTHSDRAKFLGLEGCADLADGIVFIRMVLNDDGSRHAEVKKRVYELPGAYQVAPLHHATPRYTSATPSCQDISGGADMAYQKHGSSGMSGCMAIGMQSFDNLTGEDDAIIRNYRNTGTLNKTIRAVWGSPEKSGKNPTTFAKCKAVLNKFGII